LIEGENKGKESPTNSASEPIKEKILSSGKKTKRKQKKAKKKSEMLEKDQELVLTRASSGEKEALTEEGLDREVEAFRRKLELASTKKHEKQKPNVSTEWIQSLKSQLASI